MKVFVSSVISGYEEYREAACRALEALGGQVIRAEQFPASEEAPQVACLRGVRSADATVLLLAGRYGYPQDSGLSATHEEFAEAAERGPVLMFEHTGIEREPRQQDFIDEVQRWAGGRLTASYSTPDELRDAVVHALHELQMSRTAGTADPDEMHRCAIAVLPPESRNTAAEPRLHVVVAAGPHQEVLRPARLDDENLAGQVHREALFGPAAIFDGQQGVRRRVDGSSIVLEQDDRLLRISDDGTVLVTLPALGDREEGWLRSIDEDAVRERTAVSLRFAGWLLDLVDGTRRLTDVVTVAAVTDAVMHPWRTQAAPPNTNSIPMRTGDHTAAVPDSPRRRARAALTADADTVAEDLTALLRRRLSA